MLPDETRSDSFTEFVTRYETRLRHALTGGFGPELGRDAAAEALAYGWEHWDRVQEMENPVGYLYRVGRDRAVRMKPRQIQLPPVVESSEHWVEPKLPSAMAKLSERQRLVVALLHGYEWSLAEVAELLGVSKGTVQRHADRGLDKLQRRLGVTR